MAGEVRIPIRSDADVVTARKRGRELAAQAGFSATELTIIATAISEIARNIVMFANWGEIIVSLVGEPTRQGVTVVARDAGPGIPDLERAVQDGYSGYGGMGLGLPGSRRLMDEFHRGSDTSANVAPLVRAGARIDDRDDADRTALMWAVMGLGTSFDVRPSVIAALVENGADVGATDVNGETAMFHLVRYVDDALALDRGADCIQVLLDAGANPNAENNENKTPLAVVDPRNHLVLDLLRDLGFTA